MSKHTAYTIGRMKVIKRRFWRNTFGTHATWKNGGVRSSGGNRSYWLWTRMTLHSLMVDSTGRHWFTSSRYFTPSLDDFFDIDHGRVDRSICEIQVVKLKTKLCVQDDSGCRTVRHVSAIGPSQRRDGLKSISSDEETTQLPSVIHSTLVTFINNSILSFTRHIPAATTSSRPPTPSESY